MFPATKFSDLSNKLHAWGPPIQEDTISFTPHKDLIAGKISQKHTTYTAFRITYSTGHSQHNMLKTLTNLYEQI